MCARSLRSTTGILAVLAAGGISVLTWCSAASAQTELKVSLNAPYDGSNAAFFLAEEKGYYAAEGVKPTFDPSGGSGEVATRIGSGTYDFGFGDINVLMEFNAKNPDNAGRAVYMLYYRSPLSVGSCQERHHKPNRSRRQEDRRCIDRRRLQTVSRLCQACLDRRRLDQVGVRRPAAARSPPAQG